MAHSPELSYSDLARRAHIAPRSMHATIAQLVDMGAVATESRGRASYPRLTDHGRQLLSFAAQAAAACDAALAVDPELIDCMRTQLKHVVEQLVSADTPQLCREAQPCASRKIENLTFVSAK